MKACSLLWAVDRINSGYSAADNKLTILTVIGKVCSFNSQTYAATVSLYSQNPTHNLDYAHSS